MSYDGTREIPQRGTPTPGAAAGDAPAISSALCAAIAAWLLRVSPSPRMWRFLMPVLEVIHSSLVSTSFSMSWFVRNLEGTEEPHPARRMGTGTDARAAHRNLKLLERDGCLLTAAWKACRVSGLLIPAVMLLQLGAADTMLHRQLRR